ncbi:MAG: hypothetical protein WDW36_006199 [Sanguina aurantia]
MLLYPDCLVETLDELMGQNKITEELAQAILKQFDRVLTDTGSSDGVVPLGVLGAWWTSKPSKLPVTLSTHVSATRLYQLHAQCLSWPGPISAAVYLNLFEPKRPVGGQMNLSDVSLAKLRGSIRAVEDLAKEMEASGDDACQLDVMLVFEIFTDKKGALLYPFNILRNFARLQGHNWTLYPTWWTAAEAYTIEPGKGTSFFKTYGSNPSSSPEGLAIRDRNQAIFEYAKGCWDKGDVGTPVLDWASVRCVPKLPWWRDGWKEAAVS